ncbi:hypothetical protein LINPERPRIM_LOCUS20791 [Linum perenne]
MGDFNDIRHESEKWGLRDHLPALFAGFQVAVLDSGLTDVTLDGYPFTWHRGSGVNKVEEKLDRMIGTRMHH